MNVVSYGGGTNSTAMLVGMFLHRIPVDMILFADPGGEHPHTYEYIKIFDDWLVNHGLPKIEVVHAVDKAGNELNLYQECVSRHTLPPIAFGFKTCSQKFKTSPQDKRLNNDAKCRAVWAAGEKVQKWIGYDSGETKRIQCAVTYDEKDKKFHRHFPLYEWGWDRNECRKVIERAGLPLPGKSSCFFCPSMKKKEIVALLEEYPELFEKAKFMEQNAEGLTTTKGLGRNWSWSDFIDCYLQNKAFEEAQTSLFDETPISCGCIDPCGCYDG